MSINLAHLFMAREALASCRIEGVEALLEDVRIGMILDEKRDRRSAWAHQHEREIKRRRSPRPS